MGRSNWCRRIHSKSNGVGRKHIKCYSDVYILGDYILMDEVQIPETLVKKIKIIDVQYFLSSKPPQCFYKSFEPV